jgi:SNF2 family DNA or RNA helicase
MGNQPKFVEENFAAAKALLKSESVQEPVFSRGTYQLEIQDKAKKKFFPFLQIKDSGEVTDSFCSCEKSGGCAHLAAAYLRIFNGFEEPLHVRYRKSLWNRLFQMASKRHGYDVKYLRKESPGHYLTESKTKKKLFWIKAKSVATKKRLEAIVSKRPQETEETSLKFSNWPSEEIAQYRIGKGSHALLFELSFWSDLAKWIMYLQDEGESYEIEYGGAPLPHEITLKFPQLGIWFYISEVSWPWLIPTLKTVKSPLQVFEPETGSIQEVVYDPEKMCLLIKHKGLKPKGESDFVGTVVGDWLFIEGKGFYRKRSSPIFQSEMIPGEKIAAVLSESYKELQPFLPIQREPSKARYKLHFDAERDLHIEFYLFEPGDLKSAASACFIPWVYIEGKGFFFVEDWLFEGKEKLVKKALVADFINRHRLWLQNFSGFQTHLGSLEAHLIYTLSEAGELAFEAELNFPEGYDEAFHFDEWVYLPGQGFYMKRESASRFPLHPGLKIAAAEISSFIASHKEELEQVQKFFIADSPLAKTGLDIRLNDQGWIEVVPQREYAPGIDPSSIQFFGDYLYVKGRGFSEIPASSKLPEKYQERVLIPPAQETAFLSYELEPLKSSIVSIDPRLKKPQELRLKLRRIIRERKKRNQEWLVDLAYESEAGVIDPISIWDAFQQHRRHLFSPAGLLSLKEPRFNWIRQLSKRRLDRKKGMIRLNTLEWIRLTVFEDLEPPHGNSPEAVETRTLLEELGRLETHRMLDITKLKATLRPYQEQGLQWLWFLYCHGLSGLLCDDMGLGKTHQTMALLAAVSQEDEEKKNKYLVVCPTSVIYHWQELLKRFLPDFRISTYYGLARSLTDFDANYDLLLTSYGILRTGRENLKGISFEVAIFDEIHVAKNYASQTHKALRAINGKMRLGLSGTPIENRIRELKSLIDIALPSYLPSDAIFRELFINPIEKHNDEEKKALLSRLVKPFVLRRKKSEVLTDLPEKIEEIAYSDLSAEQATLYQEVVAMMKETVYKELQDRAKPVPYMHVFAALMNLKQICDHPALYLGDAKKYQNHTSGKWDLFVELLQEALGSGQKVVVFSQYLDMLSIIESYCKKKGIGFAGIKGSTRDRSEQLRKFREDPNCSVFIASLLAAGVGIDLTAASIVIHYDRWWNPAKENQATDRVHRIGQNRGVQVFKFITKNTIEEHIHNLIEKKKGLLESIVGADDQITYLNREELLEVFAKMFQAYQP